VKNEMWANLSIFGCGVLVSKPLNTFERKVKNKNKKTKNIFLFF